MDFKRACKVMEIEPPFDIKQLRHKYHKSALKHHPDRNTDTDSNKKFQEIGSAYTYLSVWLDAEQTVPPQIDYTSIVDTFLGVIGRNKGMSNIETTNLVDNLLHDCRNIYLNVFKDMDKENSVKLFGYISRYADVLGLDEVTITSIREILREKMQEDQLVILNPSIDNILGSDIYCLDHKGETYYIPLWHDEITFNLSDSVLVVKCIPKLGEHIHMDEHNVLHVNVTTHCNKIFKDGCINVNIGKKIFTIPSCELKITPKQVYTIQSAGVARINTQKIYETNTKSDIIFNITLT